MSVAVEAWPTCKCGCGQPVPAAPQTDAAKGWIKGAPLKSIAGHNRCTHVLGATEKTCNRCGRVKPIAEFQRERQYRDGRNAQCRSCRTAAANESRARYPERERARTEVKAAIRNGSLVRPDGCSECGAPSPQAHHDDYSKPLDVRWLCSRCHGYAHRADRLEGEG